MRIPLLLGLGVFLATAAQAKVCKLEITGNDQMQYSKKELVVEKDCTEIALTLKHTGKLPKNIMGHNWILVKTSDVTDVSSKGVAAGLDNGYAPTSDKRILARTKLLAGGESDTITVKKSDLTVGEDYTYFCSFPGHFAVMKGKLVVR